MSTGRNVVKLVLPKKSSESMAEIGRSKSGAKPYWLWLFVKFYETLVSFVETHPDLLRRISPAAWQHLHFLGHYAFRDKRRLIDLESILEGVVLVP